MGNNVDQKPARKLYFSYLRRKFALTTQNEAGKGNISKPVLLQFNVSISTGIFTEK